MLGLGVMKTITNPAPGAGWVMTVPAGKAWRPWGGCCHFLATATVISRFAVLTYENSNGVFAFGSQAHATQANGSLDIVYHLGEAWQTDLYINQFLPIPLEAMWLPEGTSMVGTFPNIQPGDQVSNVGFLVEEVTP